MENADIQTDYSRITFSIFLWFYCKMFVYTLVDTYILHTVKSHVNMNAIAKIHVKYFT